MVGYQCDELNGQDEEKNSRSEDQEEPQVLCIRIGVIPVNRLKPKPTYGFWQVIILCFLSAICGIFFYRAVTSTVKYISENQHEQIAEISDDTVHLQQGK